MLVSSNCNKSPLVTRQSHHDTPTAYIEFMMKRKSCCSYNEHTITIYMVWLGKGTMNTHTRALTFEQKTSSATERQSEIRVHWLDCMLLSKSMRKTSLTFMPGNAFPSPKEPGVSSTNQDVPP